VASIRVRPRVTPFATASRSRVAGPALLLMPGLIFLIVMFLYPLAGLTGRSVFEEGFFTAQHYERMLAVPAYSKVLLNTIRMALLVTALCLILGYPLAYRLVTAPARWKLVLLICILVPFWTSLLVRSYGWMVILHPNGLLNTLLLRLGLVENPAELVHNTTGVLIGMTQIMLPYMVLPLAAVMERMDRALVPAARGLGASPWKSFVWVFLPLSLPGVYAGSLLVFIVSLGFFVVPAVLGGTEDILVAQLIQFNLSTVLNWGFAAALGTVLLVITLATYAAAGKWLNLNALWGESR
jgi:ABC-type spermidine/putrescine transport system permease subunit I